MEMTIRQATMEDLDIITAVEAECFPAAEAATRHQFEKRLRAYGDRFLLLFEGDRLISFIDGFASNEEILTDEMFADETMHDPNGAWQMVFGVNTIPAYRHQGYASKVMEAFIDMARQKGCKGLILTCKEEKIGFYARFGYVNEGQSVSNHGDAVWYQMRLTF